jgi:hypothetical protein
MQGRIRLATTAVAALLTGCGSSSATLSSRPTDLSSARDLAQLVADTAKCGSLEDYAQHSDYWTFTCQTGERSYEIRTLNSRVARQDAVNALTASAPVKAGDFFLVIETATAGPTSAADLASFPGSLQATG